MRRLNQEFPGASRMGPSNPHVLCAVDHSLIVQ